MDDRVLDALEYAAQKHGNQRYGVLPYRVHLEDVVENAELFGLSVNSQIAAAIHDLLEDTGVTFDELQDRFGAAIAKVVLTLTRQDNEDYFEYIERVKHHRITRAIKVCDLLANLVRALADKENYGSLIPRYKKALMILMIES